MGIGFLAHECTHALDLLTTCSPPPHVVGNTRTTNSSKMDVDKENMITLDRFRKTIRSDDTFSLRLGLPRALCDDTGNTEVDAIVAAIFQSM